MRKQVLHPRTAAINKSQKNVSKAAKNKALIWLAARFPEAFDNTHRIRPLKTGIMDDILQYADEALEDGISKSKLREAVVMYTRRLDYLACLKSREIRVDLEGKPGEQVTEAEAEKAALKIRKRVEKAMRNPVKTEVAKPKGETDSGFSRSLPSSYARAVANHVATPENPGFPVYPNRTPTSTSGLAQASAIVVKRKTTRAYDPDAVARLKEKLGISKQAQLLEESQEG